MTPQFKILTGHLAYWTKEGYLNHNPFMGASLEEVKVNFDEAKRVYDNIFRFGFIPAWIMTHATTDLRKRLERWKPGDPDIIFSEAVKQSTPVPVELRELII